MRNFNKVNKKDLYWDKKDKDWKFKDITYYIRTYGILGVILNLIKEITNDI